MKYRVFITIMTSINLFVITILHLYFLISLNVNNIIKNTFNFKNIILEFIEILNIQLFLVWIYIIIVNIIAFILFINNVLLTD